MLHIDKISVCYGEKKVLHHFSCQIKKGEVTSIIGPNGSGKTTLLKALSRQLPYTGKIKLEGRDLGTMSSQQVARKMSMLHQKNHLPPDMTVQQLVLYGRYPHKKWYEKIEKKDRDIMDWALTKTGLNLFKEKRVSEMSGGETQRAWIAMALVQRPQILLLDEPTTYLDISHQFGLLELIQTLNQEMGMTIMMILHDLNHAAAYSDRMIVMKEGKIAAEGTPSEVMTRGMVQTVYEMESQIHKVPKEQKPCIHLFRHAR